MAAKPRAVIVVAILAIAIAGIAAWSAYKFLRAEQEKTQEAREAAVATEQVVVAAREIPIGTSIESSQVSMASWPTANVPQEAFKSQAQVEGRVVLQTLYPGDVVTEPRLRPIEGPPGIMTYKIPEGHRAMTVSVNQVSGVAGFITPGSMVDVVLTTTPSNRKDQISKIIFQNVPVLATGQIIETKEGEPVIVPTVTLDVAPKDAERLAAAASEGQLRLLLRRSGDSELTKTGGATVRSVLSGTSRPTRKVARRTTGAAAPTKPAVRSTATSVEVWRDGSKSVETFNVKKEAAK